MPRYKITIEYDGQDFHGWQRQNKLKTIQGELETALYKFCGEKIKVFGAGRTDTGVHALAQVAHLDVDKNKLEDKLNKLGKLTLGLNYYLTRSTSNKISVLNTKKVKDSFHARFSALSRSYKYTILNSKSPSPLLRDTTWRIPKKLDENLMKNAAILMEGKHDFSAFRSIDCQSRSPIKTIKKIEVKKIKDIIYIKVIAKSFLMSQVRIIAGTLVEIGLKKKTEENIIKALKNGKRSLAGPTAPAHALVLERIIY